MAGGLTFTVYSRPVPQGSLRSLGRGRPMLASNKDQLGPWRDAVCANAYRASRGARLTGPVSVVLVFAFDRPASHYGTGRNRDRLRDAAPPVPCGRGQGDLDKLTRAVFDGITDSGLWLDDSQAARLTASKVWVGDTTLLDRPGVHVAVSPL